MRIVVLFPWSVVLGPVLRLVSQHLAGMLDVAVRPLIFIESDLQVATLM